MLNAALLLQMLIGDAEYNCSCVVHYRSANIWLTIGLSVGCVLLFVVVVVVSAVIACRCRRRRRNSSKPADERGRRRTAARNDYVQGQGQRSAAADAFELDDRNYWTIPADSVETSYNNNNDNDGSVYCSARPDQPDDSNKEYAGLRIPRPQLPRPRSQPEPPKEYSARGEAQLQVPQASKEYSSLGRPRFHPQPEAAPASDNSPYYLSLKDDE